MKQKLLFLAGLILFLNISIKVSAKKIALIAAISKYEFCSALNTDKDVELIKTTLINRGFDEKYIFILRNEQVSKKNLIKIFRTKLIEIAEPGDIVVFHFSGHGQQVMDANDDEADGYDESLVCYSAWPMWDLTEYKGEEHFLDDDLNKLLKEIRIKIGKKGSVLAVIDACYSGTMSRGNETIRGNFNAIAPNDYSPVPMAKTAVSSGIEIETGNEQMSPFILFSASKQDEVNYETRTEDGECVGSLSYAFAKSLNRKSKVKTYRGLFDLIKTYMAISSPHQTPLAEGNLDIELFSGKAVELNNYYTVKNISGNEIIINVGRIGGVHEGTIVNFYPVDTKKPTITKQIVKGEVIKSGDFTSVVKPETQIYNHKIRKSWVFIEESTYGDMKVNVFIDEKIKNRKKIIKIIEKHPVIRIVENERIKIADIIVKDSIAEYGKYLLHYEIKNDKNSFTDTILNNDISSIADAVQKEVLYYSKARYLRQLELYNPDIDVRLELLPVEDYKSNEGNYIATEFGKQEDKIVNGQTIFKEDSLFVFKIENKGDATAYFQILNIQPNNAVSILIPGEGVNEGDIKIESGQTVIFTSDIMQIVKPLGTDMFKIIASTEPMYNLRNIVENSKDLRGKPKSPFEILVQGISKGTRSVKCSVPVNTVNTYSVVIRTEN